MSVRQPKGMCVTLQGLLSLIFGCMDRSTHTENLDLYNIAQKCIKIIIGACIKFKLV